METDAAKARQTMDNALSEHADAIAKAGVPTEAEMREADVPWPETEEELLSYIHGLVDRPHDYGTCAYAMSMAATAAFRYVANHLGTSGFQASCADMDILRRTRSFKWGRLVDFEKLLYPQYLNNEHFPSPGALIYEHREELSKRAKALLEQSDGMVHPEVLAHWRLLAEA
ncbi:MAG: hypothetical protein Q8R92_01690 [Deltaproteobacteria bacterium]|nr:hypothetical protein [Deltaproteobacteria bacterium]